jgi:amino acid adenylation domain-containing protein
LERISQIESSAQLALASEAKRQLIEQYLRGEINQAAGTDSIPRRGPEARPQLSFAQERLWFLDQLMPGSPVFNVPMAVRLSGVINVAALQRAINEIVRRHEVLRTRVATTDGEPLPTFATDIDARIEVVDLRSYESARADAQSRRLVKAAALEPFDLARGPLIRTTLLRLSDRESILVVTMHHIVSDGWSLLLFFKELSVLYDSFARGGISPLSELSVQYADYAQWHREWLCDETVERQLSYWKTQLAGELPVLDLPRDRPRPAVQSYTGAREVINLPSALTQSLHELGRAQHASLFMTLLAAFKILLHRLSGQTDIIVGSPIANRPRTETENLIGFFLNNLALRSDLSGEPTFLQFLSQVRQTALDAYANQDVPFEKLLEELKPERDLSRTSIFQVYFNLFNFSDRIQLPGLDGVSFVDAWLQSEETLSKFDLTLYAGVDGAELKLALVYNTDLFDRERMAEMMRQFKWLLEQIAASPLQKISSYSLLTPAAAPLVPNPVAPLDKHSSESITALFSRQAQRRPDRVAVVDGDQSWSYNELDARSNGIANHLLEIGVGRDEVVAIYAHRSAPLVAAILAVLKAGAAFTILDPAYPEARLIEFLRIVSPRALIQIETAGEMADGLEHFLAASDGCRRVRVSANGDAAASARCSTTAPAVPIAADDLAYIAFTSGSTGAPKGVMGRHGPLTLFSAWAVEEFGLDEQDRFCMFSGLAHDPLHRDIFTPLQLGGRVCIPDPRDLEAPDRLRAWMRAQKITIANLTPAMAQLLCDQFQPGEDTIASLRFSFLVGDILRLRDVVRLRQLAPRATCVNLFGATETQRAVGYYVASAASGDNYSRQALPLGRGIKDVQLLVLNKNRDLCGAGELGEIYFRSPHLARGYLSDELLTRERFIRNPFTEDENDRLYRTGDLGRYLPDGNVAHAGRADRQIKVRGFRIEPGEIEAAILRTGQVREAAVIAHQTADGSNLIAYVVPGETAATAGALRQALRDLLPEYMVPQSFVNLKALPLTPNRKLDRRALPLPKEIQRAVERPGSMTEARLARIWSSVLGLASIGVHENFFELGGHSLLAVRLFAAIEKQFGKRLPLATLFRAPTVRELSRLLEDNLSVESSTVVPVQPLGSRPPFFCVHAVGGNVLEYYDLSRHLGLDQPFYGLQSRGLTGAAPPDTRIDQMAGHYLAELRQVQPEGPYYLGGRSLGGIIAYEMACQLRSLGESVALVALLDSYPVGYDHLLANSSLLKSRTRRVLRRIAAHISNLRSLPAREKAAYVLQKSKYGPVQVKSQLWRTVYRAYQNRGRDLPRSLQDVEQFNWLAAREYTPTVFDGQVTLFWASKDLRAKFDMVEGWRTLARGGINLREVPGTHLDLIKQPHVAELARQLNECLRDAQSQSRRP